MKPFLKKTVPLLTSIIMSSCMSYQDIKELEQPVYIDTHQQVDSLTARNLRAIIAYAYLEPRERKGLDLDFLEEMSYHVPVPHEHYKALRSEDEKYFIVIYKIAQNPDLTMLKLQNKTTKTTYLDKGPNGMISNTGNASQQGYANTINKIATYIQQEAKTYTLKQKE